MPSHQDRREPLPKGYQFGDAGKPAIRIRFLKQWDLATDPWNAIIVPPLRSGSVSQFWNVIEGEH